MPAYIVVEFNPTDSEKLQHYGALVPATLTPFSGEILVKGPSQKLHGDSPFAMQVILTFPTKDDATSWYQSAEYQAIVPIRNEGMNSQFQLIG